MSNNLRQIAKDLRSFVKRCKDVHYSDSLLITFLVTGLLTTFAPTVIRADVAEEQQEVSVEAYDSITDLRQSFIRARKENKKALRGANAELAQLLKQGDQVIKSPWASFQFGTGYTNNDWRTTYKGRGGKKLEYFSGKNDLTKYVFDASKHEYGATNLNVARNEEPNTLAINPANVHEPYKPYDAIKLKNFELRNAPTFTLNLDAPDFAKPYTSDYKPTSVTIRDVPRQHGVKTDAFSLKPKNEGYRFNNDDNSYVTNVSNTSESPTTTALGAAGKDQSGVATTAPGKNNNGITATVPTKSTFLTRDTTVSAPYPGRIYNSRHWWRNGPQTISNGITTISGTFNIGTASARSDAKSWIYNSSGTDTEAKVQYSNLNVNSGANESSWGEDDTSGNSNGNVGNFAVNNTDNTTAVQQYLAVEYLKTFKDKSWNEAWAWATSPTGANVQFEQYTTNTTNDSGRYTYNQPSGGSVIRSNGFNFPRIDYYQYNHTPVSAVIFAPIDTLALSNSAFTLSGTTPRMGLAVGDGTNVATVNITGTNTYDINSTSVSAGHSIIGVFDNSILNISGTNTFTIAQASKGNNIIYNKGTASINNATFKIYSNESNGVHNTSNANLSLTDGSYSVSGKNSNIVSNAGSVSTTNGTFNVEGIESNGINNSTSSSKLVVNGGSFYVKQKDSNIIANAGNTTIKGNAKLYINNTTGSSNGVYNAANASLSISGSTLEVNADKSNGVNNLANGKVYLNNSTFKIQEEQSNGITNAGEVYLNLTSTNETDIENFYINGSESTGIYNLAGGKIQGKQFLFHLGQTQHSPGEIKSNGIVNASTVNDAVSLSDGTFIIDLEDSNGINNLASGKVKLTKVNFNANKYRTSGVQNAGELETTEGKFTVAGKESNGINNVTGSNYTYTNYTDFEITGRESNGIVNHTTVTAKGGTFTIGGYRSNGIIGIAGTDIKSEGSVFNINANESNGINNQTSGAATITVRKHPINNTNATFTTAKDIQFSNGIFTRNGTIDVDGATFTLNGTTTTPPNPYYGRNNGIFIALGAGGNHKVNSGIFEVSSRESSGIRVVDGAKLDVTNSSFTTYGDLNNGIYAHKSAATLPLNITSTNFKIDSGSGSNAIYAKNATLNLTGTDANNHNTITIKGSRNNGIYLVNDANGGPATIKNMTFDIETPTAAEATNNGIYISNGRTIAEISDTNFNVKGNLSNGKYYNNNIGILVGDEQVTNSAAVPPAPPTKGAAVITKIERTKFDVTQTDANLENNTDRTGTGIYMYNGTVTLGESTTMTGDSNDVFVTIRNRDHDNTMTLKSGAPGFGKTIAFKATGNNNIGINIQDGDSSKDAHTTTLKIENTTGTDGWDINFVGKNNIGIKNNQFAKTLSIKNTATTYPGGTANGNMNIEGEKGIVFANLGYVHEGTLQLDGVSMKGRYSTIAAFLNNNLNKTNVDKDKGNVGVFRNGTTGYIKLQGVIGGGQLSEANQNTGGSVDSKYSVGVFANTGQGPTRADMFSAASGSDDTGALTISGLNIGLGREANSSTVLWSQDGTHIKITNNTYDTKGHVSDGATINPTTSYFGYDINDEVVSEDSVFAYATGYHGKNRHGYSPNASGSNVGSTIEFAGTTAGKTDIDMVSRRGTALLATDGGIIKAKSVRAGGYNSILAYADGGASGTASVDIDGQILAADNNLLGKNYRDTGAVHSTGQIKNTYQNIGAVALNGGKVNIKTATVTIDVKEGSSAAGTEINNTITSSLIYGMAAYAKGDNSSVKFDNGAKTTVVSGENGALYATENGQIEFAGDIINQNNAGPNATTKSGGVTGLTVHNVRNARNVGGNDHENTTPFYVKRKFEGDTLKDKSGIVFNTTGTKIDMYDGILLTGNEYKSYDFNSNNALIRDYYAKADQASNSKKWEMAKYRGMENVKVAIMEDDYRVNLGIINQPEGQLVWNDQGNTNSTTMPTGTANYLDSIGKNYLGGTFIKNASLGTATDTSTNYGNKFKSTILNGDLKVDATTVNLEDVKNTNAGTNDPFNDITMESTIVRIQSGKSIIGDIADGYRAGQGLNMNNSLGRWENVNDPTNTGKSKWIKTQADQSGYINEGDIKVWGGTNKNGTETKIAGMNVVFGTASNKGSSSKITVDHGYGIFATDSSSISNEGKITVTGKYDPASFGGSISTKRAGYSAEINPTGNNYAIVGISKGRADYKVTDKYGTKELNEITINNNKGQIKVEGDLAVGIYAENKENAEKSDVRVIYTDAGLTATAEGIDVKNSDASSKNPDARGVGIAIVNNNRTYTSNDLNKVGGTLTLNARDGHLGQYNVGDRNILTGKNGVGIYAEGSNISLNNATFTVETADNGVGLWGMDSTNVGIGSNHLKTFQLNYNGANNKNAFAMAFGSRNTSSGFSSIARNDLDITFSNKTAGGSGIEEITLTKDKAAVNQNKGTSAGIAGILVKTNDINDRVINKGDIKEDSATSKTYLRSYGALVDTGYFENWGDITLAASLNHQADEITKDDMDKVNVGIRTNNLNRYANYIENHGNIKIGDTTSGNASTRAANATNIGSWAIYGTNIKTGKTSKGDNSQIIINRNSNGIYSGDGNVTIEDTDIKVGNNTVLGHKQVTNAVAPDGSLYTLNRQTNYSLDNELLSNLGRERDSAVGVYIDSNAKDRLSNKSRDVIVDANMEIDRFSHGIVLAERTGGRNLSEKNITTVKIGSETKAPNIKLAYSTNSNVGGHVHSTTPTNVPTRYPKEIFEQGNAVYYYSADDASDATTYANVTMDGDYNTAYFTRGTVKNYGNIDLRSQYDIVERDKNSKHEAVGYGNTGIISENTKYASENWGTITTGLSDTVNMMYSVGMGAGRNHYKTNSKNEIEYEKTDGQGYVVNYGTINVREKAGIGMLATGVGSKAINRGNINLIGEDSIGMYIDRGAIGENYGTIEGNAKNLKGVIAINGGFIKNYGRINIQGSGSTGLITDSSRFAVELSADKKSRVLDANNRPILKLDANGNPIPVTNTASPEYLLGATAGELNGKVTANRGQNDGTDIKDFYGKHSGMSNAVGYESSIEEGTSGNPKTTGVGTTISMPNVVPLTTVTIDGVQVPITNIDTDASSIGDYAKNITLRNSIQSGGTRIIDLSTRDEFGNRAWPRYRTNQNSEITTIGMYIDTSGVKYTNPYDGLQNLTKLGKVNLYFGTEATMYTNAKAIRFGDVVNDDGSIDRSNILKPFNDALRLLPGGSVVNSLSAGLTWHVSAKINDNNQVTEVVMSKIPYHSFAHDGDKALYNFANNLDNLYEIARPGSSEKMIFNTLNSFGNGQGNLLAQAFDQMRGHIYGGIQQRINATSNLLTDELAQLRREGTASKDSNKIKAFGRREEYKTDTAGIPDWHSNAGGFIYQHEDETVKLGDRSGWYAGAVNNYFTFRDLARSYENQAMLKAGLFKQTPLDEDGTLTFTIGGDAFIGKTNTKRRYTIGDVENLKEYRAKSDYYSYGADINAKLEKEFRLTEGFSIVPNLGLDTQYGRFSTINEEGDMALKIKSNDYYSIKPNAGVDFRYAQPVFKKSNFVASLGLTYETELGRLSGVKNEAQIKGAWTDYYTIKGDKENRKGNFKSDLNLGLDNGRLGFTVNTGYETKGHNFKAGLGLRVLF